MGRKSALIGRVKREVPLEWLIECFGGEVMYYNRHGWSQVRCPFHDDDNPSASLSPDGMFFMCHSDLCGVRGDIIDLVQEAGLAPDLNKAITWLRGHFR